MRAQALRVNRVLCEKAGENRREMFTCQIGRDAAESGCRLPTYQPTDARYELLIYFFEYIAKSGQRTEPVISHARNDPSCSSI
jgi:hypothetical protein